MKYVAYGMQLLYGAHIICRRNVETVIRLLFEKAYSMNPLLSYMRRFDKHNGNSSDHQTVMLINEDLWLRIKQGSSNLYYKSKLENEDLLLKIL